MSDQLTLKPVIEVASFVTTISTLFGWLPNIAAAFGILWYIDCFCGNAMSKWVASFFKTD